VFPDVSKALRSFEMSGNTPSDMLLHPRNKLSAINILMLYSKTVIKDKLLCVEHGTEIDHKCVWEVCIEISSEIDTFPHDTGDACSWVSLTETSHF